MSKWIVTAVAVWMASALPASAQGMMERIQALDLNRDGAISRQEAETARAAMFDRLDADGDGYVSESERNASQRAGRGLADADVNNDGRISRAEAMGQPYRAFERLDSNSDGVISASELESVRGRRNAG